LLWRSFSHAWAGWFSIEMFFAYISSFKSDCQVAKVWQVNPSGQEYDIETTTNGNYPEMTKFRGTFTELVAFLSNKGFTLR
jgi:hypothetical protein